MAEKTNADVVYLIETSFSTPTDVLEEVGSVMYQTMLVPKCLN